MRSSCAFVFGLCLLAALAVSASAAGIAESMSLTPVFDAKSPLVIPVSGKPGTAEIGFPAVRKQGNQTLCVRFRAFLMTPKPSGWNPYLRLALNGKPITSVMPDGAERLLNRGELFRNSYSSAAGWWGGADNQSILTFFGPGAGEMDARAISAREEGYWYLLDISDLASYIVVGADDRIESAEPNKLTFTNTYCSLDAGETAACREMRIEDITIGYLGADEVAKLQPATAKPVPELKGEVLRAGGSTLTIAPSGAMQLAVGGERYSLSAAYSYPGKSVGYHAFTWAAESDSDWVVSAKRAGTSVVVKGESARYSVVRTISRRGSEFRVAETIENKTAEPIGVGIRYDLITPKRFAGGDVYLAGNPDERSFDACAVNPTVFVRQSAGSIGIVAEDDVLRLQLSLLNKGNAIQYGTEHFGLGPRAKYTVEYTVYPSASRDYFDFINRVRRDWKVNSTIPGPFAFSEGEVLPERKIELYAVPPWFLYATGSGLSKDEFKKVLQPKLTKLHSAQPDAISLGMIETNLVPLDRKTIVGGEILPASSRDSRTGAYGYECTAEQTKLLEKSPWFDCMLKTADGRAMIDTYYPDTGFLDLMVYPAPGNYQLSHLLSQIDYLMDVVGFRGIYIDQFSLAVRGFSQKDRFDFSRWDGHTVDIDERGQIARKYTDVSLVGAPARRTIIQHVLRKGGIIVTNGHSASKLTDGLRCVNFQETEWTDWNPVEHLADEPPIMGDMSAGHLDTPVGLGIRPARFAEAGKEHCAEIIHKWVIACLKNGQLYYYYANRIPGDGPGAGEYGALNHMFPFTPVELHAGWLVGRERIITAKSGTFVWDHREKPVCLLFDLKGRSRPYDAQITRRGSAWEVTVKLADWNEIAVIEPPGMTK